MATIRRCYPFNEKTYERFNNLLGLDVTQIWNKYVGGILEGPIGARLAREITGQVPIYCEYLAFKNAIEKVLSMLRFTLMNLLA